MATQRSVLGITSQSLILGLLLKKTILSAHTEDQGGMEVARASANERQ